MKTSKLEFYKFIISKVAFDKILFLKEIRKSIEKLNNVDLVTLQIWCYREFGNQFKKELDSIFIV